MHSGEIVQRSIGENKGALVGSDNVHTAAEGRADTGESRFRALVDVDGGGFKQQISLSGVDESEGRPAPAPDGRVTSDGIAGLLQRDNLREIQTKDGIVGCAAAVGRPDKAEIQAITGAQQRFLR